MLVLHGAGEEVGIPKALRARALAHRHDAVLRRVQHAALLAHRLGIRHRRAEVARPRYAAWDTTYRIKRSPEGFSVYSK